MIGTGLDRELQPSASFALTVRPHLSAMRRLAAVAAPGLDPDDVVQETLLRAWQKFATYRPEKGSLRTWLLAITAERSRRLRLRQRGGTWTLADGAGAIGYADALPDVDLRLAVHRLPRRQRQAILLHYYVDLSVAETADLMGCSVGTVKSTLSDARGSLARKLGGFDA